MAYLPHQQRVIEERDDLDGKLTRLTAFFGVPLFHSLPDDERNRLTTQAQHMTAYLRVLNERIAAFPPA
jgi:hypothetical protein